MDPSPEVTADVPRVWARPVIIVPVLALLALVGGQLPSFSPQANLYTMALGGAMVWLGLSARLPRRPLPDRPGRTAVWWVVPAVAFAIVEGATFLAGTRRYPTLSRLLDPLLEDEVFRSAGYLGWLAAFWVLVRR
jgi:hypothetical protein